MSQSESVANVNDYAIALTGYFRLTVGECMHEYFHKIFLHARLVKGLRHLIELFASSTLNNNM